MIVRHRNYPVRMLCRLLRVSPSGYYAWRGRALSRRAVANARLVDAIRAIHGARCSPKIWEELVQRGERCAPYGQSRMIGHGHLRRLCR